MLDQLLDERHASIVGAAAAALSDWGWSVDPEVTFSIFGERGSIDVLAYVESLRVVEIGDVKSVLAFGGSDDAAARCQGAARTAHRGGAPGMAPSRHRPAPRRS